MKPISVLEVHVPQVGLSARPNGGYLRQEDEAPRRDRSSKKVHYAFIPMNYVPLEESDSREAERQEKKAKRKEKYKKYKKNVRKALRYSWKCLMLGLHNFSLGYGTPLMIIPEVWTERAKS